MLRERKPLQQDRIRNRNVPMKLRLLLVLLVTCGATLGLSRLQNNASNQGAPQPQQRGTQQNTNSEISTPVVEGVLTPAQKIHGDIFSKQYEWYRQGKKLRDLPGSADTGFVIEVPNSILGMDPYHVFLKRLTCDSNAIVIGSVSGKNSQLTLDGTFVFTDYEFAIVDVVKNNPAAPIQNGSTVTVARPGGAILLNGRRIQVRDMSFEPFKSGARYVLFLKFIPTAGAYMALNSKAAFQIQNNRIFKVTKESLVPELDGTTDAEAFLAEVRATNPCN
jgi:hypothetical protein